MKKIAVLTSGGDAPGMNACIRSVVRSAHAHGVEMLGVMRGFDGLLARSFHPLQPRSMANTLQRGGTILMSSRCESFMLPEQRAAAYLNCKREGVEGLVCIGGDGSLRGLLALGTEHGFPIVGVPGTIDNDLEGTDFSIGFDTALNTAVEMVDKLRDTAAAYDRVMLVEVMGRQSGHIALDVALACGAEAVLLPEITTNVEVLVQRLNASAERGKHSQIVIIAEGEKQGGAVEWEKRLEGKVKTPVRFCVLGHVQRGGNPTARDRLLAGRLGAAAVEALVQGRSGVMVGEINGKVVETPLPECLRQHKPLPHDGLSLLGVLAT